MTEETLHSEHAPPAAAVEEDLAVALERWAGAAPPLSRQLVELAMQDNARQRRVALWELLADLERPERTRLMTEILGASYREENEGLRLLFSFLCGRPVSFLYAELITKLHHTRRFHRKLAAGKVDRSEEETRWLERLLAVLPDLATASRPLELLDAASARLHAVLSLENEMPFPFEETVAALVKLEGEAASLRGQRLVERIGDYDPRGPARILPMVIALDEWQGDLHDFADRGPTSLKHPLRQFLGEEETVGWKHALKKDGGAPARLLSRWIGWMEETEMLGNEPAGWVAILKALDDRRYRRTLLAALVLPMRWRDRRLGLKRKPPEELFPRRAVSMADGYYWVDLDQLLWSAWVSADGIPASPEFWLREESPLLMLRSRIQDEAFCNRILDNSQWTGRPGVVEAIARGSRSLKILLRIARTRKFYTGSANRGVPVALLANPVGIPLSALRPFLSPRFITRHDLAHLARGGPDVREEISREAREVLRHM
ncbi:MAG: hypothetical protein JW819_09370 [Candidatus Krumholzibacteriota bacterium]|nr:hypothetical protein [Candidatus Krumholzibacteriota bacterium]